MKYLEVLHIAETLRGGIASYLDEVLPAQVARYGAGKVCILAGASQMAELGAVPGLVVLSFADTGGRLRRTIALASKLRTLNSARRFDVVHAHSTFAGLAMRLVLGFARPRPLLIYCAHGWAFDRATSAINNQLIRRIEVALSGLADHIICISGHDHASALRAGIAVHRLVLLPNGIAETVVALPAVVSWPPGRIRVLFVGRFDRQKGIDVFTAAMTALGADWFACVIGAPVVDTGSPLSFPANMRQCGWLPRAAVQDYLASCDVVVVPSRWEGFGLIAIEAMRAGKAIVASRTGGLAEIVLDGVTGRLISPGSALELEIALRTLDPDTLRNLGQAGRARFLAHYTSTQLNNGLFALYEGDKAP